MSLLLSSALTKRRFKLVSRSLSLFTSVTLDQFREGRIAVFLDATFIIVLHYVVSGKTKHVDTVLRALDLDRCNGCFALHGFRPGEIRASKARTETGFLLSPSTGEQDAIRTLVAREGD